MAGHKANGEVRFEVPGVPIASPRKRVRVVFSKKKQKHVPQHYTEDDAPINDYKFAVQLKAKEAKPKNWPMNVPLEMDVLFIMPRPSDMTNIGRGWNVKRIDRDNLAKGIGDAMIGVLYDDDGSVCDGRLTKVYARLGEEPRTVIRIRQKFDEVPGLEIEI